MIDKITTCFESSQELRNYYAEKVDIFQSKYKTYMDELSNKNKRKENGDIALFTTINKERTRIKVIYQKHIEVFEVIIKDTDFQQYLKKNFYAEYCNIQKYMYKHIILEEETSFLIRKIYYIYKQYAQEYKKISPNKIYTSLKKQKEIIITNYQETYDKLNNDPTEPEQLETYVNEDLKERRNQYYKSLSRGK